MQVFEKKLTKKMGVGTTKITNYYRKLTKIIETTNGTNETKLLFRRQHRHLLLNGEMGIEDKINNISAGERTRSDRSSRQAR